MKIINSETLLRFTPATGNPRNSEGDFARLPDGNILFAYSRMSSGASDDAVSDIYGLLLSPGGREVVSEAPFLLVSHEEYRNCLNLMSVSLMTLKNGDLALFYLVRGAEAEADGYGRKNSWLDFVMRTSHDGRSFKKDTEVLCSGPYKAYYVVNNNRVIRTGSGRLMFAAGRHRIAYLNGKMFFDGVAHVHVFHSDDEGKTWQESKNGISLASENCSRTGLQEPGIYELPDGSLRLYARTDLGSQYTAISTDGGESWSAAGPSAFTSPVSPMKIARNPYSGKYYAIYNPIPEHDAKEIAPGTAGRTPLVISESTDGIDFSEPVVLEDDPRRGFCYTSVFFLNEKKMLLAYCSGGKEDVNFLGAMTLRRIEMEESGC